MKVNKRHWGDNTAEVNKALPVTHPRQIALSQHPSPPSRCCGGTIERNLHPNAPHDEPTHAIHCGMSDVLAWTVPQAFLLPEGTRLSRMNRLCSESVSATAMSNMPKRLAQCTITVSITRHARRSSVDVALREHGSFHPRSNNC